MWRTLMRPASYGALAWGYNKTGCFLWARVFPNQRVYIQADWKFQQQPVEDVSREIHARTEALGLPPFTAVYADETLFDLTTTDTNKPRVESLAAVFRRNGLMLVPAPKDEAHGWQRVQDYLRAAPDGQPWLVVSPKATALVRTLPTLVQDEHDPDLCTGRRFAADALRALLTSRPRPGTVVTPQPSYPWGTVGWLKGLDEAAAQTDFGLHR